MTVTLRLTLKETEHAALAALAARSGVPIAELAASILGSIMTEVEPDEVVMERFAREFQKLAEKRET